MLNEPIRFEEIVVFKINAYYWLSNVTRQVTELVHARGAFRAKKKMRCHNARVEQRNSQIEIATLDSLSERFYKE